MSIISNFPFLISQSNEREILSFLQLFSFFFGWDGKSSTALSIAADTLCVHFITH